MAGGAFLTTLAVVPSLAPGEAAAAASPQLPVGKIGPGYARMRPIDLGKPEKVAYSTPYYPHAAVPRTVRANKHAAPTIIAAPSSSITAPPIRITAADQSSNSLPDIHRVY